MMENHTVLKFSSCTRRFREIVLSGTALLCLFFGPAGCDDSPQHPGEGFYSYDGYRDWWRIPLQFPWQIIVIDTFDSGSLEEYDPSQNIADPNVSSHAVLEKRITEVFPAEKYLAFRCGKEEFGVLVYSTKRIVLFHSESELGKYLRQEFPGDAAPKFESLQQCYDEIWEKCNHPAVRKSGTLRRKRTRKFR